MLVETSDDGPREVRGWNLRIQKEASRELQSWAWQLWRDREELGQLMERPWSVKVGE